MSWDAPTFLPGVKAGADLSAAANQYKLVKLDSSGDIVLAAAATDNIVGVLYNTPASGKPAKVAYLGVALVQANATIDEGDRITAAADGQGNPFTAAGSREIGIAMTAVANAGEIFSMLITHGGLDRTS